MNTATIIGRAGQDAEIKYFESGKVKTTFSLAVNRWDRKTNGEVTDWYNIEVWDKQAEFAADYVKKGRLVAIDGVIANNRWVDKTTNNESLPKSNYGIHASCCAILLTESSCAG